MFRSGFVCAHSVCVGVSESMPSPFLNRTLQLKSMLVWLLVAPTFSCFPRHASALAIGLVRKSLVLMWWVVVRGRKKRDGKQREGRRFGKRCKSDALPRSTRHSMLFGGKKHVPKKCSLLLLTLIRRKYSINFHTLRTDESMIYTINSIAFCSIAWSILKVTW